jgi:hypothetical protein
VIVLGQNDANYPNGLGLEKLGCLLGGRVKLDAQVPDGLQAGRSDMTPRWIKKRRPRQTSFLPLAFKNRQKAADMVAFSICGKSNQ